MDPITLRRELSCRATPRALWALLADVPALQRALGQVALPHRPVDVAGEPGFEYHSDRAGGLRFVELPAQWRSGTSLLLRRHYPSGPLDMLSTRFNLTPVAQGSKLEVVQSLLPRRGAFRILLRLYGELSLRHVVRTLGRLDEALSRGENPTHIVSTFEAKSLEAAITALRAELDENERSTLERLLEHLRGRDDLDTQRVQPVALAESWDRPADEVLTVCLAATGNGLLELRFEVVCASCRLPALRLSNLETLTENVTCPRCAIAVPLDIEKSIEVSFDLAPAMKPATARSLVRDAVAYAKSSPHHTPHVIVKELLPATALTTLQVPTEPGEYRLSLRGGASARLNVSTLGPPTAQLVAERKLSPASVEVTMGGTLEIAHEHTQPRMIELSHAEAARPGAAGHTVILHPRFRRLFGSGRDAQRLPPGMILAVSQVALLQSELVGTLELCKSIADKAALALVREHLELLGDIVEREKGSLVRSDREGITAAFSDELAAVRVALLLQQAFVAFRDGAAAVQDVTQKDAPVLGLRIGLFVGPCHLCSLVGALEYFGTTQLVCQRLLRDAHAGDVMLPAELAERFAASRHAALLPSKSGPRFALSVRGLAAPLPVVRMRIE